MNKQTNLQYGETPFDRMSKDELLLSAKRMYAALVSLNSALRIVRAEESTGYWGYGGSGGVALEKSKQCLEPIHKVFDSEDIYRSYFRYAEDLLFERNGYRIGFGWAICPRCGVMIGEDANGNSYAGTTCGDFHISKDCNGVLKSLEWSDLKKGDAG